MISILRKLLIVGVMGNCGEEPGVREQAHLLGEAIFLKESIRQY